MKRQRGKNTGSLFQRRAGGAFYGRWCTAGGQRVARCTGTRDRKDAERILAAWLNAEALRRQGIVRPEDERRADIARRPLATLIDTWAEGLAAQGRTRKHATMSRVRVRRVLVERLGCASLADVQTARVQAALGELLGGGTAARTVHHYGRNLRAFTKWAAREGHGVDVLEHLRPVSPQTDRCYERRALDADECAALLDVAEHGPAFRGLDGLARAMLYRTALGSGLRVAELASLRVADFSLVAVRPCVVLAAKSAKNRKATRQPLRRDLAELLAEHFAGRRPSDVAFGGTWSQRSAAMIRADLRRARALWLLAVRHGPRAERRRRLGSDYLRSVDAAGRVVDFHSLRQTFVTQLVLSGANIRAVQQLARHSTPVLTMNVYARLGISDVAAALDGLPAMPATPAAAEGGA